jgi:hypothetical protein
MYKNCPKCKTIKSLELFDKRSNSKYYHSWCKSCESFSNNKRQKSARNSDPLIKKLHSERSSKINKERYKDDSEYRKSERERHTNRNRVRRQNDPLYRFKSDIKSVVRKSFKRKNLDKSLKTEQILGIDLQSFFDCFNKLATDKYNMLFDSKIMEIDHIIPLYTAKTKEDVIKLNHYSNLQPLLKSEHKEKTKQDIEGYADQRLKLYKAITASIREI